MTNREVEYEIVLRVREYIDDNAINLNMLARELGLSYQQLYQKLYNRQSIDITTYMSMCRVFELNPDVFISDLINKLDVGV